jgi:hypothetical protein
MTRAIAAGVMTLLLPIAASAQTRDTPSLDLSAAQTSQGPMTVERIHNGFLAAPEFKVTEVNHQTSGLMGGYAGVVFAEALFIGGGGYGTVTNEHGNNDLAYGGLIMQWFGRTNETFGYSAKMLIGGGTADSTSLVQAVDGHGHVTTQTVRFRQDFFAFEPEVTVLVRFAKHARLTGGVGYRFTGNGWYNNYYGYSYGYPGYTPNGVTGSVGVQIGGGS